MRTNATVALMEVGQQWLEDSLSRCLEDPSCEVVFAYQGASLTDQVNRRPAKGAKPRRRGVRVERVVRPHDVQEQNAAPKATPTQLRCRSATSGDGDPPDMGTAARSEGTDS